MGGLYQLFPAKPIAPSSQNFASTQEGKRFEDDDVQLPPGEP
jgi:hypothetical protein